jgi:drug/metabolite transporter (DMT)-like permease
MSAGLLLSIVIASGVVYHIAQKSSGAVSPWPMLVVAYGAAFALAVALALVSGDAARWHLGRGEWTAGLLVGLAAFGVEAGYFFLYRAGWPLASTSVIAGASTTAVLAVIGVVLFREHLTAVRAAGIAFAAGGAAMIARG